MKMNILTKTLKAGVALAALLLALFIACDGFWGPIGPSNGNQFNSDINYGSFTDSRDGKKYRTVKIGDLTWMAENLNHKTSDSWCYSDNAFYCDAYGRLYNWNAARSACPSGWRLPDSSDWGNLMTAVGGSSTAGRRLKSKVGWYSNGNGTDDFGFSALPGGDRWDGGGFIYVGYYGFWWSATEIDAGLAHSRNMVFNDEYVYSYWDLKSHGLSVRCARD